MLFTHKDLRRIVLLTEIEALCGPTEDGVTGETIVYKDSKMSIPIDLIDNLKWEEGEKLEIYADGNALTIKRNKQKKR
jgi:hypothetical protein